MHGFSTGLWINFFFVRHRLSLCCKPSYIREYTLGYDHRFTNDWWSSIFLQVSHSSLFLKKKFLFFIVSSNWFWFEQKPKNKKKLQRKNYFCCISLHVSNALLFLCFKQFQKKDCQIHKIPIDPENYNATHYRLVLTIFLLITFFWCPNCLICWEKGKKKTVRNFFSLSKLKQSNNGTHMEHT